MPRKLRRAVKIMVRQIRNQKKRGGDARREHTDRMPRNRSLPYQRVT